MGNQLVSAPSRHLPVGEHERPALYTTRIVHTPATEIEIIPRVGRTFLVAHIENLEHDRRITELLVD